MRLLVAFIKAGRILEAVRGILTRLNKVAVVVGDCGGGVILNVNHAGGLE